MKELFFKKGGQKTAYTYRNLRMERVGFLKIASFETDDASHRLELMDRGHAVVVLPVDFKNREVYLIEQPRHVRAFVETEEGRALMKRAREGGWTKPDDSITLPREAVATLESPAGIIDLGDTPKSAAVRELLEETGLIVEESDLEQIASYYPSVGGTAERLTAFFADVTASGMLRRADTLSDEDIDRVTVWKLGFDDVFALLDAKQVITASSNILFRELYIRDRLMKAVVDAAAGKVG